MKAFSLTHGIAIKNILGTTKSIVAKDSKTFAKQVAKYVDSKDQSRGKKDKKKDKTTEIGEPVLYTTVQERIMAAARKEAIQEKKKKEREEQESAPAFWPLIRLVNVRCNAKALSTGAILVDLPGKCQCYTF